MRMKWYRPFNFLFTSIATGLAAAFLVLLLRPDLVGRETFAPAKPVLLERTGGNISRAATESGMHRTVIHRKLKARSQ